MNVFSKTSTSSALIFHMNFVVVGLRLPIIIPEIVQVQTLL